jgi:hypothetical protein
MAMINIPVMPPQTLATMATVGFFPDWFILSSLSGLVLSESGGRFIVVVTKSIEGFVAVEGESVEMSITVVDSCIGSENE